MAKLLSLGLLHLLTTGIRLQRDAIAARTRWIICPRPPMKGRY